MPPIASSASQRSAPEFTWTTASSAPTIITAGPTGESKGAVAANEASSPARTPAPITLDSDAMKATSPASNGRSSEDRK